MTEMVDRAPRALGGAIVQRSVVGYSKYGQSMDRCDLELNEWAEHGIEEALDLAQYLIRVRGGAELLRRAFELFSTMDYDPAQGMPEIIGTWLGDYQKQFGECGDGTRPNA